VPRRDLLVRQLTDSAMPLSLLYSSIDSPIGKDLIVSGARGKRM